MTCFYVGYDERKADCDDNDGNDEKVSYDKREWFPKYSITTFSPFFCILSYAPLLKQVTTTMNSSCYTLFIFTPDADLQ